MSSSDTTMKSPLAMTADQGMISCPVLLFSSSSFSVYCVGFLSSTLISSPDFDSNIKSDTSPKRFPLLLTTVFPNSAFENLLWSSICSPAFFWVLCVFKVFCDGMMRKDL